MIIRIDRLCNMQIIIPQSMFKKLFYAYCRQKYKIHIFFQFIPDTLTVKELINIFAT